MRYLPLTEQERKEIRNVLGIHDTGELFTCTSEGSCQIHELQLPSALSEPELLDRFAEIGKRNRFSDYVSFLGGGLYSHFIPEVVHQLSTKSEFVTPYTPYQPEVSQGNLQAIFEYQTMMTMLTGLDVANASLYDGGTATAEAVLLAMRKSGKNKVLLASSLHPEYREIVRTYLQNIPCQIEEIDFHSETGKIDLSNLQNQLDDKTACVVFQSPNFFGVVEEGKHIAELIHAHHAYAVMAVGEAMSLPFLTTPAAQGVDIVVGSAQSFGIPLGFGGPSIGFIVVKEEFLRQMPGRIVGETKDLDGKRGYVLTLSTREQHIKREKATSNICTNQAWCALRAGIYMATMGKKGLETIARLNHLTTAYFVKKISTLPQVEVRFKKDFFNEVVIHFPLGRISEIIEKLKEKKIIAGIPLHWFYKQMPDDLLVNFTELHRRQDVDRLVQALGEVV